MTTVVPAIIPRNKEQLEEEIRKVVQFASLIQVDISDGIFTPYKTWPYNGQDVDFFEKLKTEEAGWPRWEDAEIELHLMVKNPEEVLLDWIHTGVSSVIVHIEATDHFGQIIDLCKEHSVSLGIALKPSTDVSRIEPFVSDVDFIQVMGNDLLGKHGVKLDPKALDIIRSLRASLPESIIAIDIGVDDTTAQEIVDAGANKLISGADILNSVDPGETFRYLESVST